MRRGRIEQRGTPQEVFDHPANAFVMDFLGNVNIFHGRVAKGRFQPALETGDQSAAHGLAVAYPDYPHEEPRPAAVYVRPHELDIAPVSEGEAGFRAKVLHVNPTGPVARVQLLTTPGGLALTVDLSLARYSELGLKTGDLVGVSPRRLRVFLPEDSAG
jgi:sulfate transport system ATP-binding protein